MAETALRQNGGQGLHVGLAGMLVTNCLFQNSHLLIFSMFILIAVSNVSKFLFALEAWGTTQQICEFGD